MSYGTKACLTNEIEQAPTRTDPDIWMGVGRPWAKGRQTRLAQDANLGDMDKVAHDAYLCAIQLHDFKECELKWLKWETFSYLRHPYVLKLTF